MIEKSKEIFNIFELPVKYEIDKNALKKSYYSKSKETHPDISTSGGDSSLLNHAYSVLNDDYLRARLFTFPTQNLSPEFLKECLDFEERLEMGENIKSIILEKIDECRKNYLNPEYIAKWAYYKRLLEIADSKSNI